MKSSIASAFTLAALALAPSVSAHGYIKLWGLQGSQLERAQKSDLRSSAFRAAPDNTGWIGSRFIENPAIVCGQQITPRQTVAAPSGTLFSAAGQSAGRELGVKPGQTVQLVVSGNPGEGWPHPRGHVQTYLASCGGSCTNFDASKAKFFKIQGEKNGIQNTLRPAYDGGVDGNRYNVKLPSSLPDGSYIFRFELIAFGQSSPIEGQQDQYYPFCGQINVSGSSARLNAAQLSTVSFPGAYKNGNINENGNLPGPAVLAAGGGSITPAKGSSSGSKPSKGTNTGTKQSVTPSTSSSLPVLKSSAPSCAAMCLRVKISEKGHLAPSCGANDGACMCAQKSTFVQAFYNCAKDHCGGQLSAAKSAFDDACAAVGSSDDDDEEDCDDENTKRDLELVEQELERVRREASERLRKREEKMTLEERYPAPPHPVIRPIARSTANVVEIAKVRRSRTHGVSRAAHGKRMVREKRAAATKQAMLVVKA